MPFSGMILEGFDLVVVLVFVQGLFERINQVRPVCRYVHGVMEADADWMIPAELPEDILVVEQGMGRFQIVDRLDEGFHFIEVVVGKEFPQLVFASGDPPVRYIIRHQGEYPCQEFLLGFFPFVLICRKKGIGFDGFKHLCAFAMGGKALDNGVGEVDFHHINAIDVFEYMLPDGRRHLGEHVVNPGMLVIFAVCICLLYTSPSPRDRG